MSASTATSTTQFTTRLWLLLFVLSGNMLLDAVEVSVAMVAAPVIGDDLGVGPVGMHAPVTAFALGFGLALLPGAWIVARYGSRPVYLAAMAGFAVTSLLGAVAPDMGLLVVTRVLKGCCVALTAPTGLAIIAGTFAAGPARNRAVTVYSAVGAAGFSAGLLLSGLLTTIDWRVTWLFPAPVALVLLVGAWRLVPVADGPARPPRRRPVLLGGGLLSGGLLTRRPLLGAVIGAGTLNGTFWAFLYLLTLQLQRTAGWSPLATALAMLPAGLLLVLAASYSGRAVTRFGTARLIAAGALGPPVGYLVHLLVLDPEPRFGTGVLPAVLLVGVGFALGFAALHVQALTAAGPGEQQLATGVYQTAVQLLGALVVLLTAALLAVAGPGPDGLAGHRLALSVLAGLAAAGLAVAAAISLRGREDGPLHRS